MKRIITLFVMVAMMAFALTGCGGVYNVIQTCIVSNTSYTSQSELKSATQKDTLTSDKPIYASVHFIESPKGMEYTAKWYLNGKEIKSEIKATAKDKQDVVVYELESEKAVEGTLKLEVTYKNTVLLTKEPKIQ